MAEPSKQTNSVPPSIGVSDHNANRLRAMLSGSSPAKEKEEDVLPPQKRSNVIELPRNKSKKINESNDVLDLMMGNAGENDRHNLDDFLDDCISDGNEV